MTRTEIVERFFSMEKKLRELSGELIAKHMTAEEIKKAIEKDIKDFSDFAYNNSDVIYNAIKEDLIEQLKNDAIKPIDALFIYFMVTNFTSINSLQFDCLSHSVVKINQVLADSAKSSKGLQEPISEDLIHASNNYCLTIRKGYPRVKDATDVFICNAFEAGAKWQREQMLKDAIDTRIDKRLADMIGYTGSENVKVIIIKD